MRFTYCPHCGEKLVLREIGDEGKIPYCEKCSTPLWDMFTTSVICAVVNEFNEIALIKQSYGDTHKYVCVAGIMKIGESAEETAKREIKEEIGLDVLKLQFVESYPFEKKEMLMLGFKATVKKADFKLSSEVNEAHWFSFDEAEDKLKESTIAGKLVKKIIEG